MRCLLVAAALAGCSDRTAPPVVARPVDAAKLATVIDAAASTPDAAVAEAGQDFIDDARRLYRVAACGGEGPLPAELAPMQAAVDRHCKQIAPKLARYRAAYFETARRWFEDKAPADLPSTVVYSFSGGDLISALVAFPNATEITTVSLELAGDPRKLPQLTPAELERDLEDLRREIGALISVGSNTSELLAAQQRNALPGQISSFLMGLVAGGYEPVAMRFFGLDAAGAIHYYDKAEIDADTQATRPLRGSWTKPSFAEVFRNVELRYRKLGEPAIRVHRHIAWNVESSYLRQHPELLRHLEAKGKVAMLVKGASYLLWLPDFAIYRTYLRDHLAWMISDSTGLAPMYARGLVQEPYGKFVGPVIEKVAERPENAATQELWARTRKPMPFRFGYLDREAHSHVLITYPASSSPAEKP
jgi:hypothetical protein